MSMARCSYSLWVLRKPRRAAVRQARAVCKSRQCCLGPGQRNSARTCRGAQPLAAVELASRFGPSFARAGGPAERNRPL